MVAACVLQGVFARAQAPTPSHPTSTPYAGDLSIFEDANRADKLHIERVMDLLGLKPGKVIADIGAGGGWFSVRAARRVAPTGHVIAEEINPQYVNAIRERAQHEKLGNIEEVLGTPDDPRLATESVDAVLMLKVYHEIAHPALVLRSIHAAMRPGARFGIIERPGTGSDHGLDEKVLLAEVERNGFRLAGRYDFTKDYENHYFLVFEKK